MSPPREIALPFLCPTQDADTALTGTFRWEAGSMSKSWLRRTAAAAHARGVEISAARLGDALTRMVAQGRFRMARMGPDATIRNTDAGTHARVGDLPPEWTALEVVFRVDEVQNELEQRGA